MYSFRKRKQERSETQCERDMRVESRREILEDRECEMERHRDAVEGLLLHQDSQFTRDHGTHADCRPSYSVFRNADNSNRKK